MERTLTMALGVAALLAAPRARADEPIAAAPSVVASPCAAAMLDLDRLVDALRVERAAGERELRLDCDGAALSVSLDDGAPLVLPLDDVAPAERPRVVALAIAERAERMQPADDRAAPASEPPPVPSPSPRPARRSPRASDRTASRVVRAAHPVALEPWSGLSLGAGVEALGLPSDSGALVVGPRVLASLWGRSVGAHVGAGLLLGSGGGGAARLALLNARFALAGPAVAGGRLDVELGFEGGSAWTENEDVGTVDQRFVAVLSADVVLRLPLSRRAAWGLSFDLGYRRAYGADVADLVAVGVGIVRALDAPDG